MSENMHAPVLLVLWDIDHTLIENSGISKETYAGAFQRLTGRAAQYPARTDGRTDPEIMRDLLVRHGIDVTDDYMARVPEMLESAMASNASRLRERGYALPGSHAALAALRDLPGVVQAVLSGNIRSNAFVKLSVFGLHAYLDFEVGGYGSDDSTRANLVGIARKRASLKYGATFDSDSTVLIGDTPRDVRAALDGGARIIGVASGSDTVEVLRNAGADVVLPDLRDTSALVDAVKRLWSQAA